jgi:phosphatidylglycerophosphate synthase
MGAAGRGWAALPNSLTLLRLGASPLLPWLAFADRRPAFNVLATGLLLTDVLDGWLARALGVASDLGRNLDTAADWVFYPCFGLGALVALRGFFGAHRLLAAALAVLLVLPSLFGLAWRRRVLPLHLLSARVLGFCFGLFLLTGLWLAPRIELAFVVLAAAAVRDAEECAVVVLIEDAGDHGVRTLGELLRRRRSRRRRSR